MQIDHLELRNFRGFEHFAIDLHPRATVLIGDNGSGKSSILDALAIVLSPWVSELGKPESRWFAESDIRRVNQEQGRLVTSEQVFPVSIAMTGSVFGEPVSAAAEIKSQREIRLDPKWAHEKGIVASLERVGHQLASRSESISLPVLDYFRSDRLRVRATGKGISWDDLPSRNAGYWGALDGSIDSENLAAWMRHLEQVRATEIQDLLAAGRDISGAARDPHLSAVQEAVTRCIPDARGFYYNLRNQEIRFEFENGVMLPFSFLSDGYRNFIGMVADIAWRTVQLNPHLADKAPRETPGIVLIDELELHLHPGWQRLVLGALLDAFPKIQFVVTTHSPQVVASAEEDWMRVLQSGADEPLGSGPVHGKDSNSVLERVMGTTARPVKEQTMLDQLARLIDDEEFAEAHELLERLREVLGDNDEEIVGMHWELSIAETGISDD